MALCCETVRCELQYESFSMFEGDPTFERGFTGTEDFVNQFSKRLSTETSLELARKNNMKALFEIYKQSRRVLKHWRSDQFRSQERPFKQWLATLIWHPVEELKDYILPYPFEYFALSYAWTDKTPPYFGQEKYNGIRAVAAASGITMREILEEMEEDPENIDKVCGKLSDSLGGYAGIIVDGKPILIGKNLELALRTLREVPDIYQGTRIWVDALCINHGDIDEKNLEVKRMGQIYGKADRVISYLGDEMDRSGSVLEYMNEISQMMNPRRGGPRASLPKKLRMPEMLSDSMAKLFNRAYFNRIWVIQEVVLGGDKGIVICGKRQFSWKSILQSVKVFEGATLNEMGDGTSEDVREGIKKLSLLRHANLDFQCNGAKNRLYFAHNSPWLRIPNVNQSRDSRDSIYGMMYLLPKALSDLINVDYAPHNRFVDVMRTFAEAYIKATKSLQWILYRNYMLFIEDLNWPTWVPNLAQAFSPAHVKWIIDTEYLACPDIPCYFEFGTKDQGGRHLLICKGVQVDVILLATVPVIRETVSRTLEVIKELETSRTTAYAARNDAMIRSPTLEKERTESGKVCSTECAEVEASKSVQHPSRDEEVALADIHRYGSAEGLEDALRSCCIRANIELPDNHNTFSYGGLTLKYRAPDRDTSGGSGNIYPCFEIWDTRRLALFTDEKQDDGSMTGESIMEKDFARLFTTRSGYVGATLGKISIGDEVWLVGGCRMPVVLRRNCGADDSHALIGAAYIPGLMKGEGLKEARMGNEDYQKVRIA
ncbi:hypothetical protein MFRU_056g00200 [Monilinia fructicola]|nr:hypothetical protein MFRU_056g00200 [Monilinia fructicola]